MLNKIWANTDRNHMIFLLYFPFTPSATRKKEEPRTPGSKLII
jgi:hypothetical protein